MAPGGPLSQDMCLNWKGCVVVMRALVVYESMYALRTARAVYAAGKRS